MCNNNSLNGGSQNNAKDLIQQVIQLDQEFYEYLIAAKNITAKNYHEIVNDAGNQVLNSIGGLGADVDQNPNVNSKSISDDLKKLGKILFAVLGETKKNPQPDQITLGPTYKPIIMSITNAILIALYSGCNCSSQGIE